MGVTSVALLRDDWIAGLMLAKAGALTLATDSKWRTRWRAIAGAKLGVRSRTELAAKLAVEG